MSRLLITTNIQLYTENEERKVLQRSIILGGIWEFEVGDMQAMRKHEKTFAVFREINTLKEFIKENLFYNGIRKWP